MIINSAGTSNFFCTSFSGLPDFPTHSVLDVTSNSQWSLLNPAGQPVPANRAAIVNGVLNLIDPTLPGGTYKVQASVNGITDQAKVQIQLP